MGLIVLDASVVIALRDGNDAHHASVHRALRRARTEREQLVLPASALAECLVRPLASGLTEEQATGDLLSLVTVEPLTHEIAIQAAKLRATTKLRLPDALVVATGLHLDSKRILTCDKAWRGIDKRIRVLSV